MCSGIEVNYSVSEGLRIAVITPYAETDLGTLQSFWEELQSKPAVLSRIKARGLATDREILKEYLICRYGGNDNVIDMMRPGSTSDYCHCGNRGHCKDEGFEGLCSVAVVGNVKLNPSEVATLNSVAHDKSMKETANTRHRSVFTIETQARAIRDKFNVHGIASAIYKATSMGLVNTCAL